MMPKSSLTPQSVTTKLNKIITQSQNSNAKLEEVCKKLDILIVIELARSGLSLTEVAKVLDVSEDTIERMVPFRKLKPRSGKE